MVLGAENVTRIKLFTEDGGLVRSTSTRIATKSASRLNTKNHEFINQQSLTVGGISC